MARRPFPGDVLGRRPSSGPSAFAVGAVVIAVVAIAAFLAFTKDVPLVNPPYEIKAAFRDSVGIGTGSPVRIAGVDVGKVTRVEHTSPGARSATVTLAIRDAGRPIHADATARIRPRIFLEGNFFVDLRPGTPGAREMKEGAVIAARRTATPVQFDQVLAALKSDTRNDLRQVFAELRRAQRAGGARAFNRSLRYQPDAYRYSAVVTDALLGKRPHDLSDWIRDQATVARALDRHPEQLKALLVDFDRTAAALAARQADLRTAIGELPDTLRAGLPALAALNAAFPDVRTFARAARPGVRSLGPTVDALLPLVRELRGAVGPQELRGLSRDLRAATPALARVSRDAVPVLEQVRALAGCTNDVLLPFGDEKLVDKAFPATGPVHEELVKFLPGLAGESRSFDANGQWFKVLGSGGAETLNLGNGLFGSVADPIAGVNPPADRSRPPLRPDMPCETQQTPDLRTVPRGPPSTIGTAEAATRAREAKAQDVAVALLRAQLRAEGRDTKVLDRAATAADLRRLAARTGLTGQLGRALKRGGGR
ncbi:MAG: MlaD family protein [Actinomycetota bacterium]|nr:MlaD family protein [Actinomycetota bacterium]